MPAGIDDIEYYGKLYQKIKKEYYIFNNWSIPLRKNIWDEDEVEYREIKKSVEIKRHRFNMLEV